MGNPFVIPEEAPAFGVRHCLLCRSCEELVYRHGMLRAICSFMGVRFEPEEGCARWQFDPASLGDEGIEPADLR